MTTPKPNPKKADHSSHPHPTPKGSPLRLAILLGVLVVVVGALVYDWVIAPPQVKAANEKLHATVIKHNEIGLTSRAKTGDNAGGTTKRTGLLYSDDIQKILGMKPAKVESAKHYTIEYYRWWGWIPRSQNSITVLYIGDNPAKRFYSTHYVNSMPDDTSIPGKVKAVKPDVDLTAGVGTDNVAVPVAGPGMGPGGPTMPGMRAPGGGGGGKAKGRPKGTAEKTDEADAKKGEEPAKEKEPKDEPKEESKPTENAGAKESAPPAESDSKTEEPKSEKE